MCSSPSPTFANACCRGPAGRSPHGCTCRTPPRRCPVLAYFFGGGWVLGSLETAEPVCRRLANAAACAVVSIAYRLRARGSVSRPRSRTATPRRAGSPSTATSSAPTRPAGRGRRKLGRQPRRGGRACSHATGRAVARIPAARLPAARSSRRRRRRCASRRAPLLRAARTWRGAGRTISPTRPTARARWPRRCAPPTFAGCRRRS